MAIVRTAGTEIIRSVMADDIDSTATTLIYGVQHHIYTVLSVIFYPETWQAAGNWVKLSITGYDVKGGTSAANFDLFRQDLNQSETFVWNDKFSFNGYEPVDFTGPIDSEAKQDAIADQGSGVRQILKIATENAADAGHVICTYIDQNNA